MNMPFLSVGVLLNTFQNLYIIKMCRIILLFRSPEQNIEGFLEDIYYLSFFVCLPFLLGFWDNISVFKLIHFWQTPPCSSSIILFILLHFHRFIFNTFLKVTACSVQSPTPLFRYRVFLWVILCHAHSGLYRK